MDLLRELGHFTFASRLQRLSYRLKSEVSTIYHACGMDFDDHWFLVGYLLSRHESMTVSEMAARLGFAQPDIVMMTEGMVKHGLLKVEADSKDPMQRRLSLTEDGRETVVSLEKVWEAVGDVTRELIESTHPEFIDAITAIEKALDERSLFSRVTGQIDMDTVCGPDPGDGNT